MRSSPLGFAGQVAYRTYASSASILQTLAMLQERLPASVSVTRRVLR
jgi:hypothetical protein